VTLPGSGPLSLGNIQTEFGGSAPTSISEYYSAAAGVPGSGPISFSQFHGKSAAALGAVMFGYGTSAYFRTYAFSSGFGAAYAAGNQPPGWPNIGSSGFTCRWHPSGVDVAGGGNASPYLYVSKWTDGVGYGTKYADSTPSSTNISIDWIGTELLHGSISSPFIHAYQFTPGTGFVGKRANPGTIPTGQSRGIGFRPGGDAVVTARSDATPFVTAYNYSAGFGSQLAAPASPPPLAANSVAFSPSGAHVVMGQGGGPSFIIAYNWSGGFGSLITSPGTPLGGTVNGTSSAVRFNPAGTELAATHAGTPFASAYAWSGGFGSKRANPGTLPTNTGQSVDWNAAGTSVVYSIGGFTPPYASAYAYAGGFGSKYADATPPSGNSPTNSSGSSVAMRN